jgi:hypothetical protein
VHTPSFLFSLSIFFTTPGNTGRGVVQPEPEFFTPTVWGKCP